MRFVHTTDKGLCGRAHIARAGVRTDESLDEPPRDERRCVLVPEEVVDHRIGLVREIVLRGDDVVAGLDEAEEVGRIAECKVAANLHHRLQILQVDGGAVADECEDGVLIEPAAVVRHPHICVHCVARRARASVVHAVVEDVGGGRADKKQLIDLRGHRHRETIKRDVLSDGRIAHARVLVYCAARRTARCGRWIGVVLPSHAEGVV
mmetsp:Transcript_22365/g.51480  ORF Transcript_22365/g.51480 Transcript_22365/m.51480 type:complete len:207 (-) Transcript_22365:899-1519(-)